MPFKIHVLKSIWLGADCVTQFDRLYRIVEFRSVPFIGLSIDLDGFYPAKLKALHGNAKSKLLS